MRSTFSTNDHGDLSLSSSKKSVKYLVVRSTVSLRDLCLAVACDSPLTFFPP